MTDEQLARSVHQRLLNLARAQAVDFNSLPGLTSAFTADAAKAKQWLAFKRRLALAGDDVTLEAIGREIAAFVAPLLHRAREI